MPVAGQLLLVTAKCWRLPVTQILFFQLRSALNRVHSSISVNSKPGHPKCQAMHLFAKRRDGKRWMALKGWHDNRPYLDTMVQYPWDKMMTAYCSAQPCRPLHCTSLAGFAYQQQQASRISRGHKPKHRAPWSVHYMYVQLHLDSVFAGCWDFSPSSRPFPVSKRPRRGEGGEAPQTWGRGWVRGLP